MFIESAYYIKGVKLSFDKECGKALSVEDNKISLYYRHGTTVAPLPGEPKKQ